MKNEQSVQTIIEVTYIEHTRQIHGKCKRASALDPRQLDITEALRTKNLRYNAGQT